MSELYESDILRAFYVGFSTSVGPTERQARRGAHFNVDDLPRRALGRLLSEQVLGQQLQSLPCVPTPHQGDQGITGDPRPVGCRAHRQVIRVPVPRVENSQEPSMVSTSGRMGPEISLKRYLNECGGST